MSHLSIAFFCIVGSVVWPHSYVTNAISGTIALYLVGSLLAYLRYTIDMMELAQKKVLLAEQQRNVADQQRQEAFLAEEQQRQVNRFKDQIIMNVSHELRTPLTATSGYLELLHDGYQELDSTTQLVFLERAIKSCNDLTHLVNTVMDAVQVTSEVKSPHQQELSVLHTIQEVIDQLDPHTREEHSISLEISEQLMVWADQQ